MLTREQILTLPAEQLAEVSARMMGWVDDEGYWESCDKYGVLVVYKQHDDWKPHTDHNDAREVADWALNWLSAHIQDGSSEMPKFKVYKALQELFVGVVQGHFWSLLFHTPEQLTRAILLAFVDNGGEI